MKDLSKLTFDARVNYMKRGALTGNAILTLGAYGNTVTQTITHNLGYIPVVHVSYEATGDGTIWPSERISRFTETSLSGNNPTTPKLVYWTTTTTLTIQLINLTTPVAAGTRAVYWVIYLDYGNV